MWLGIGFRRGPVRRFDNGLVTARRPTSLPSVPEARRTWVMAETSMFRRGARVDDGVVGGDERAVAVGVFAHVGATHLRPETRLGPHAARWI